MAHILGRSARAYWDSTDQTLFGDSETQTTLETWVAAATAANNIMDLSLEIGSEFVDATTRAEASQGFASEIAVLNNGRVTFDAKWLPSDTFVQELVDCWQGVGGASSNSNEISMIFLDQAYTEGTGTTGLAANFSVSFSKTENLRDIQKMSVTLTISSYPYWYEDVA